MCDDPVQFQAVVIMWCYNTTIIATHYWKLLVWDLAFRCRIRKDASSEYLRYFCVYINTCNYILQPCQSHCISTSVLLCLNNKYMGIHAADHKYNMMQTTESVTYRNSLLM